VSLEIVSWLLIALVVLSIPYYNKLNDTVKLVRDANFNVIREQTPEMLALQYIYNAIYSILLIAIQVVYRKVAIRQVDGQNFQYQIRYENALNERLFLVSSFAYYIPLLFIAFDPENDYSFTILWQMLAIQMVFKQFVTAMKELLFPIFMVKFKRGKILKKSRQLKWMVWRRY
jgi:hypothetical protein